MEWYREIRANNRKGDYQMSDRMKNPVDNAYLCGRMQARLDMIKVCTKVDVNDENIAKALSISVEYVQFLRNILEQYPNLTQKERAWIAIDEIYEKHWHEEDFWKYDGPILKRSRKKERKG